MKLNFNEILKCNKTNSLEFVKQRSYEISEYIFSNFMVCGLYNNKYLINSLEFYIFKEGIFEDENTHGKKKFDNHPQLTNSQFYVHMHPRISKKYDPLKSGFKNVQRWGFDITCGDTDNKIFGGILIKGINKEYVRSSSECIKLIRNKDFKSKWSQDEIDLLRRINLSDIYTGPIKLIRSDNKNIEIKSKKRSNLTKESYRNAELRFDCNYN